MTDLVGKIIGRYKINEQIGQDDISLIYRAYDPRLERNVLIKVVRPQKEYSQDFFVLFKQHAQSIAQLSHANIVKILDYGEFEGLPYLVMEDKPGGTLADILGTPIRWQDVFQRLTPIARALGYAHERGVIHRDIKPSNIYLGDTGDYSICDFGIVQLVESEETKEMTGTTVGISKPEYMSPEQGKGLPIDHRADIYSLGVLMYEMITGHRPFEGESPMEIVIKQVTLPPTDPRKYTPELPTNAARIILTCLEKDPTSRYQSMDTLISDIEKSLTGTPSSLIFSGSTSQKRPLVILGAVVASLVLITAGVFAFLRKEQNIPASVPASLVPPVSQTTSQPSPEATHKPTELPTIAPTPTPTALPKTLYPVINGRKLPTSNQPIAPANFNDLVEIARFGYPFPTTAVWSPDNSQIFIGTSTGILVYDAKDYALLRLMDTNGWVTALDITADGTRMITGAQDGTVALWDVNTGQELAKFSVNTKPITSVTISQDGLWAISGSEDKTASIWNLNEKTEAYHITTHTRAVQSVEIATNRRIAITASGDFRVIFWNLDNGEKLATLTATAEVNECVISPDETLLACGLRDATVVIWDIVEYKINRTLKDATLVDPILAMDFSPNSKMVAVGAQDGVTRIWNILSGEKLYEFGRPQAGEAKKSPVIDLKFSPSGENLLSVLSDGAIQGWKVGTPDGFKDVLALGNIGIAKVSISPDSRYMAVYWENKTIEIWDLSKGEVTLTFQGSAVRGNPFSPDSTQAVFLNKDNKIILYDITNGREIAVLTGYPPVGTLSFLSSGKMIASAASYQIVLWSISSTAELSFPDTKVQSRCQVVHMLDGKFLAAGSENGMIEDENAITRFCPIQRSVRTLGDSYLKDGSLAAFGLDNKTIELWENLDTSTKTVLTGHEARVKGVAISHDGLSLASCSEDGQVILWDISTKSAVLTFSQHNASVNSVIFSEDDKLLITASSDGTFQIWGVPER